MVYGQNSVSKDTLLMGSYFSVTAVHENEEIAKTSIKNCFEEVIRIEKLISSWNPASQTSKINAQAGLKPVQVDFELFSLIERSVFLSSLTEGAFDISFASIAKVWDFKKKYEVLPDSAKVKNSVGLINYQWISLNKADTSVFLQKKGMKIGFGAVGKGYAADRCKEILKSNNIHSGVINAGGDLTVFGEKPNGDLWNVGITDPRNQKKFITSVALKDQGIVTSGNYERFIEIKGKKYGHIVDPKSGWPVQGLTSVTVIAQTSEFADALATTVFVMGKNKGLRFINKLNGVECILVDEKHRIFKSENIELIPIENEK